MPDRSRKKRPSDLNQRAWEIVQEATRDETSPTATLDTAEEPEKNPAAVSLGRLGGKKGGPARAKKLSAERRREIAKKAAEARWKHKQEND